MACRRCGLSLAGPVPGAVLGEPVLDYDPRRVRLYADARAHCYLAAFVYLWPLGLVIAFANMGKGTWEVGSSVVAAISVGGAIMLVVAGQLVIQAKRMSKWVAAPPLLLMALWIPVGTLVAVRVSRRIDYALDD
jgi:tryptophan-rich sensory protein